MKRLKHISKKTARIVWCFTELLIAFVGVVFLLILYELNRSPMDGRFLLPEIEQHVFSKDLDYHLNSDSVVISANWHKPGLIQVEIDNMNLLRSDNSVVMTLPKALFAYDFWHIITLNYMPSTIILNKPTISVIQADNSLLIKQPDKEASLPIDEKKLRSSLKRILSFRHINIHDAEIVVQNVQSDKNIKLSQVDLTFKRHFRFYEKIHFQGLVDSGDIHTNLMVEMNLNRLTKDLTFEAGIPEIRLKNLGYLIPFFNGIDFATQISAKGELNISKRFDFVPDILHKVQFQIKSLSGGTLNLPDPLTNIYPIKDLQLNGMISEHCKTLKFVSSKMTLKNGIVADLSAEILGIDDYLKKGDLSSIQTTFKSTVLNMVTEQVADVWPRKIGTSTHDWVATHLTNGHVPQADFVLNFKGAELVDLYGDVKIEGMTVNYLEPMKPISGVSGHVYLHPTTVEIKVNKGNIGLIDLINAELLFTDVDIDPTWAKINLDLQGPVKDIMHFISSKPLEFPQLYGIDAGKSEGTAKVHADLFFRLDPEITTDEVKVQTSANLSNAKIRFASPEILLENANLQLSVSNDEMSVVGQTDIMGIPLQVKWQEYFKVKNDVKTHYEIAGKFNVNEISEMLYPDINHWAQGVLDLSLTLDLADKADTISGKVYLDAKDASVHLFPFDYVKPKSENMKLMFGLENVSAKSGNIIFDLMGTGTVGTGRIEWGKEFMVDLNDLHIGESHFSFNLLKNNKDFKVNISGDKLDCRDIFNMPPLSLKESHNDGKSRSIDINVDVKKLILNAQKPISNIKAQIMRNHNQWKTIDIQMKTDELFNLKYLSEQNKLETQYENFGTLMSYLGNNVFNGGKLLLDGYQEDGELKGKINISKTDLKEPGFLTQAFSILGILDAFMGNDLTFDEIEIPFTLTKEIVLKIEDAFAYGTNLGLNFQGNIDLSQLNLTGSVIPAYAINSLPGKIPLVGWLFRNGVGGGLVNLPYSISGTPLKQDITFHPSGIVTPGVLGEIF